jgi:hypothetical protein
MLAGWLVGLVVWPGLSPEERKNLSQKLINCLTVGERRKSVLITNRVPEPGQGSPLCFVCYYAQDGIENGMELVNCVMDGPSSLSWFPSRNKIRLVNFVF